MGEEKFISGNTAPLQVRIRKLEAQIIEAVKQTENVLASRDRSLRKLVIAE